MTHINSPSIQAIDKQSVHRICSGQVVLDLATAVKELIENGLDAGADNIEVKLRNFGRESIEVSDNGSGIETKDFESIALKHYTSKIKEFNDLTFVDTFGFRGEALSSLSAVSDLSIVTKHTHADVGTRIDFDHNGKVSTQLQVAKEQGTTVTVTNLFNTLPVRYKEFSRNYKKEFSKLVNVLYSYGLINSNCRFKCTNHVNKNKNLIVSTNGKNQVLDIITSLFGTKQSKTLIAIVQKEIDETISEEYGIAKLKYKQMDNIFAISGHISNVIHGYGRSSPDRQFVFINKRPCDFSKVTRLINEVYHQYNRHQYPFIMLDISLNREFVDVNVTPDKRQIMIHQEKVLLASLKSSLKSMFDIFASQYQDNVESNNVNKNIFLPLNVSSEICVDDALSESNVSPCILATPNDNEQVLYGRKTVNSSPLERFRSKYSSKTKTEVLPENQKKIKEFFIKSPEPKRRKIEEEEESFEREAKSCNKNSEIDNMKHFNNIEDKTLLCKTNNNKNDDGMENIKDLNDSDSKNCEIIKGKDKLTESPVEILSSNFKKTFDTNSMQVINAVQSYRQIKKRKTIKVDFNFASVKKQFEKHYIIEKSNTDNKVSTFYAKISPSENKNAETELSKNVSKNTFLKMKILGQFNLGFIIAKHESELFIIDQHATDEKYNFETLQRKHCLKGQRLIKPLTLELTNVNEIILIDNLDIFKKNGFDFEISEQKNSDVSSDHRIKLLTVPTSKNWTFSVDDVEELIFMLSDSPGIMCRPSRVRSMFASRACRMSIMVGTALSKQKMKELVSHMSELDHPWNCPHGRPTMRHLINLKRVPVT